jgi:hypothetical protein
VTARVARVLIVAALFALAGCERAIIEGRAINAQGEALPGVVVRLAGTERQDLSDARGRFRMTASRTATTARLQLSKSGYAPSEVTVDLKGRLLVSAPDSTLWALPMNPGVYTLDDLRYLAADWVLPKQYYLKDGSTTFGAELPETVRARADAANLFLVCYRTPRYNARLSRLAPAEATVPGSDAESQKIWVESGTIGAGLQPVDHPAGELLRIFVDRPLEPGIYCVHWGAMEGYTTLESRIYAFEILAPSPAEEAPVPEGGTPAAGDANTTPDKSEQTKTPPPDLLEPPSEDNSPPQQH